MNRSRKPIAEINVVPYIDVMLVLLVIFMITTPLLSQGVNVDLPQAAAKPLTQQQEAIIVSINASGDYFLNIAEHPAQALAPNELSTLVKEELIASAAQGAPRRVYVKGDKQVEYDKVVKAMVLLQTAGAESVGLITQDPAISQ